MDSCLICSNCDIKYLQKIKIEDIELIIYQCYKCGFAFQSEFKTKKLDYDEDYYLREKSFPQNFLKEKAEYKFSLIKNFLAGKKSILEIGCSTGELLEILKKNNYEVIGIEISEKARKICNEKNLIVYDDNFFVNNSSKKFDVIIALDVIEHLNSPDLFLKKIKNLLNTNGIIILETPNFNSILRKLNPYFWIGYNKYHLIYFNCENIIKFFEKNNFKKIYINTSLIDFFSLNFWKRTIIFNLIKNIIKKMLKVSNKKILFPTINKYNFKKINYYGDEIFAVFQII
ncbi:MAG TPA: class I SAM-dependent methyltransferase [bacterium]|nr:class I SAM-dependent methyltransferase [bacterium]HOL47586.1 class I SAM-dependent methyltransferase [bacterium]